MFLRWYSWSLKWCVNLSEGFALASTSYIYKVYVELE
jgi:hypothetical protein